MPPRRGPPIPRGRKRTGIDISSRSGARVRGPGGTGEGEHRPHRVVASLRHSMRTSRVCLRDRPGREGVADVATVRRAMATPGRRRRRPSPGPLVDSRPRRMPRRRPGGRVGGAAREEPMADDRRALGADSGRRAAWARLPGRPGACRLSDLRSPPDFRAGLQHGRRSRRPSWPPGSEAVFVNMNAADDEKGADAVAQLQDAIRGLPGGRPAAPPAGRHALPRLRVAAPVPR